MIEVRNVTKSFEGRMVLKDISTVFEKGKKLISDQADSLGQLMAKNVMYKKKI